MSLTVRQQRELHQLTHGPRGGRLRGKDRPTEKQAEHALRGWSKVKRTWTIFWLILFGKVR